MRYWCILCCQRMICGTHPHGHHPSFSYFVTSTVNFLRHWQPFLDLKLMFVGSRHTEHLRLSSQQRTGQTFLVMTMGDQIPVITEEPTCGCRKFQLDEMGDHFCTCTVIRMPKRLMTGWLINWLTFSTPHWHHTKTQHVTKSRGRHCGDLQLEPSVCEVCRFLIFSF
jgi:hypothetical protein